MRDTIVEEVQKARDEYARRFNYDLDAICADLQRRQQLSGVQFVSLPARPAQAAAVNRKQPPAGTEPGVPATSATAEAVTAGGSDR